MRHSSPLRYPGGKTALSRFLEDVIDLNDVRGGAYYEPFAGGAGAAFSLLEDGVVSELFLNDADIRIYAFWKAALNESERFANMVEHVPLTIDEWKHQHEVCSNPDDFDSFSVGFSAFYMNRCNRSGVLTGAGPIGGYSQSGRWKLDVRFNRENLAARIIKLGKFKNRVQLTRQDAIHFLKANLPRGKGRRRAFTYLDPPYVIKGQRLYLNAYRKADHAALARYMLAQNVLPWVMSYDDSELVRNLYRRCKRSLVPIRYTLQEKRNASELIISPPYLALPTACRFGRNKENLLQAIA